MKGEAGLVTREMVAAGDDAVMQACDRRLTNFIENVYLPELKAMQAEISGLQASVSTLVTACERSHPRQRARSPHRDRTEDSRARMEAKE